MDGWKHQWKGRQKCDRDRMSGWKEAWKDDVCLGGGLDRKMGVWLVR